MTDVANVEKLHSDKRKRINRIKTALIFTIFILILIPTVLCIVLGIRMSKLEKKLEALSYNIGVQDQADFTKSENKYAYASDRGSNDIISTIDASKEALGVENLSKENLSKENLSKENLKEENLKEDNLKVEDLKEDNFETEDLRAKDLVEANLSETVIDGDLINTDVLGQDIINKDIIGDEDINDKVLSERDYINQKDIVNDESVYNEIINNYVNNNNSKNNNTNNNNTNNNSTNNNTNNNNTNTNNNTNNNNAINNNDNNKNVINNNGTNNGVNIEKPNKQDTIDEEDKKDLIYYGKKVYLTFDDGPSYITDEVLDILAKYNIKATFFVVGHTDKKSKDRYMRIVDEGHTLGIHSYSHKYKEIYNSVEDFDKDFTKLWQLLYDTTGYTPTIYRFPGGSLNNVNSHGMEEFIRYLNANEITYYDWNVVNGDATGVEYTEEQMIDNVLSGVKGKKNSIVLMHDGGGKEMTVATLPNLLEALISGGADILPLDETVSPIQQIKASSVE